MWKIGLRVFRTVEQRTPNAFWCHLNNAMYDRSEWFSWYPVCDLCCLMLDQMLDHVDNKFFRVFTFYYWFLILRPFRVCDHNFSLICSFNLQFSQNYMNIDTDEIQHWICYFVQSLWNKNTINERSNGRTFHHILIPYKNTFFFLSRIVLYSYVKNIQPV